MEARSTPALPTLRLPAKNHVLKSFDMTAFSWKSPEPLALAVPLSRFTPRVGGGSAFYGIERLAVCGVL